MPFRGRDRLWLDIVAMEVQRSSRDTAVIVGLQLRSYFRSRIESCREVSLMGVAMSKVLYCRTGESLRRRVFEVGTVRLKYNFGA